jgi:hypothetical protein
VANAIFSATSLLCQAGARVMRLTLIERGVTGVPGISSPTARRRELGAMLRALRMQHGLTVEQVAERLLCSPSKVSRLETGHRGASARDVRDLCDLYGVAGGTGGS